MFEYESTTNPTKSRSTISKHRLLWIQTHGEIPKGNIIHHKNGEKKDNRIENLESVTYSEHILEHCKRRKQLLLEKEKLSCSPNN